MSSGDRAAMTEVVPRSPLEVAVDVRDKGAIGDGVTNNAAAFAAALAAGAGKTVIIPPGTWRFDATLAIPANTVVKLLNGAILLCRVVGGADGITLANGARLCGESETLCQIKTDPAANIARLITNAAKDGTQEYAYLDHLWVFSGGGAITVALVDFVSLFVNSAVRHCIISDGPSVGLRIAGGANAGFGPVLVEDCWIARNAQHNVVVTEDAGAPGSATCSFRDCTIENWGSGFNGIYIKGFNGVFSVKCRNMHFEHGVAVGAASAYVYLDGCAGFELDGAEMMCANVANKSGVVIANNFRNYRVRITNIANPNAINPILNDLFKGNALAARNIGSYVIGDPGNVSGSVDQIFTDYVKMQGSIAIKTKAGVPVDGDWPAGTPLVDGTLAIDTTNNRIYVRIGGVWKSVVVA